jgi:hypothetical protein
MEMKAQGISSNNTSFLNSEVISERLDTSRLIAAIKSMLEGKVVVPRTNKDTGMMDYVVIQDGEPLMNELGVQMMMISINLMFSPFFAQGFLTRMDYDRIIQENDNNLSEDLMSNLDVWKVNILNYNHVLNSLINLNQGYSSQAIEGHLTNSITQSVRFVESNTTKERGGFLGIGGS